MVVGCVKGSFIKLSSTCDKIEPREKESVAVRAREKTEKKLSAVVGGGSGEGVSEVILQV